MTKQVFCNKINKEVYITFNVIPAKTIENPNQYLIGLISKCSACNKLCEKCLVGESLYGLSISL